MYQVSPCIKFLSLLYVFAAQRMMSLYVSSHYKNTPNDLQLMSDAPAHQLFVLLGELGCILRWGLAFKAP